MKYAIEEKGISLIQDPVIVMKTIKFFFRAALIIEGNRNFLPGLGHSTCSLMGKCYRKGSLTRGWD